MPVYRAKFGLVPDVNARAYILPEIVQPQTISEIEMALVKVREVEPLRGWKLMTYRAPIFLYWIGLGELFGQRFLLLTHIGRNSGTHHQTVLEVVRSDPAKGEYVIASGFGQRSQWYKNLVAHPEVVIQVGRRRLDVQASLIPDSEAEDEMVGYGHRHPGSAKMVAGLIGYKHEGSDEDLRALSKIVPLLMLKVTPPPP